MGVGWASWHRILAGWGHKYLCQKPYLNQKPRFLPLILIYFYSFSTNSENIAYLYCKYYTFYYDRNGKILQ